MNVAHNLYTIAVDFVINAGVLGSVQGGGYGGVTISIYNSTTADWMFIIVS